MASRRRWSLGLLSFLLLALGPLVLGLGFALLYSLGLIGRLSEGLTLEHWQAVLGGAEFYQSLGYSLAIALVSIGVSTLLALLLVSWAKESLQRGALALALYLPLALPTAVVAFLGFQWWSGGGLLARAAYQLGWIASSEDFPVLINDRLGVGIVLAHLGMATPFLAVYFSALYRSERVAQFRELAQTLGMPARAAAWRVVMPVLLWRGRATLLLYGMFVFGSYEIPLLLGSQSPQMLTVLTVRKLSRFSLHDVPQTYVIVVCYAVLVLMVFGLWAGWRRYAARLEPQTLVP